MFTLSATDRPAVEVNPVDAHAPADEAGSYKEILKSSATVGGSQVLTIAFGIVRAKAMALILGPSGVGLAGLYGSITDVVHSVAGMGVNISGVRQIAEAVGTADRERIARTAIILRRTSVFLGLLGAAFLIAFSAHISDWTFGTTQHVWALCLLSIVVLLRLMSDGQCALFQGMRRISDLAKINVVGALTGTLAGIPLVYFFRENGVAPALATVAAATLVSSYWYGRRIQLASPAVTALQARRETAALLKLGSVFMASGLMMMGSAWAVRTMVLHRSGFEASGLYQSAWTLGGLYVAFILQAMGADFYPRLAASAHDHTACNRLVNEQARVGLLLAGPGVTATMTVAPLVMTVFYTAEFGDAVPVLRWICLGMTLRVINWPMGYIILAKGRQDLLFWTDLMWTVVHISLAALCIPYFGARGAGIAFFCSYLLHGCVMYPIVGRVTGFAWSPENRQTAFVLLPLIALVFIGLNTLPLIWATCIGVLAACGSTAYSARVLLTIVGADQLSRPGMELVTAFFKRLRNRRS